jgi:hypothetical protein
MKPILYFFFLFTLLLQNIPSWGLEADSLQTDEDSSKIIYIEDTFFSTRIINGHSVETLKKQQLEFRISHRFGQINEGIDQFYGLDHGVIHLGLEYGLKDWLEIGIGRSTFEKTVDGFIKANLIRQSTGAKNFPVHLSYFASTEITTIRNLDTSRTIAFHSRLNFVHQLLIARKFNENFSAQLAPTFVHRNLVPTTLDKNDLFALGLGARYKITRWIAITAEYFYVNRPDRDKLSTRYYNPLSIGIDIATGEGHVFQIMLTNSQAMREAGFIGKTTGNWRDGGIHLGFNISRLFSFASED